MTNGDKVLLSYEHHINSRSSITITKIGTFINFMSIRKNKRFVCDKFARVQFEGNKYPSKVEVKRLKLIKKGIKEIQ